MKKGLKIISLAALLLGSPIAMMAEELCDGPESEVTPITLSVSGSNVHVCGANGLVLNIYNLAGVKVASYRLDSADKTIETGLSRGCYIFKVGNLVRKVSVN